MRRMTSVELYLRLLRQIAPYRHIFALSLVGMLGVALTEVTLPALLKPLLDGTFVEKDETLMRWMPLVGLGVTVVAGFCKYKMAYSINLDRNKIVTYHKASI